MTTIKNWFIRKEPKSTIYQEFKRDHAIPDIFEDKDLTYVSTNAVTVLERKPLHIVLFMVDGVLHRPYMVNSAHFINDMTNQLYTTAHYTFSSNGETISVKGKYNISTKEIFLECPENIDIVLQLY